MTEDRSEAPRLSVLVVDDEANIRKTLTLCLESRGHAVTAVSNAGDALSEAGRRVFDLAFVDLRLGTEDGLDLIPVLLAACPWLKIVVVTAYASIDTAVEAMKRGAADYMPKPFTPEQVDIVTERAAAVRSMERRIEALEEDINKLRPEISFESGHPAMQQALELARTAAFPAMRSSHWPKHPTLGSSTAQGIEAASLSSSRTGQRLLRKIRGCFF